MPVNLKGKQLIEAPHEELTASLDYVRMIGSDFRVGFHIDANHVGSEFYTPNNDPRAKLPSFWESNARMTFGRGDWEIGAWVKNLNNNDVPGGVTIDTQTLFLILRTPAYPRRYGVEMNYWF